MAKVMISMPDTLLTLLDAEAERRGTTRSGLLQAAVRRELGVPRRPRAAIMADLDELSAAWSDPTDVVELIHADRRRDG